MDLVKTQIKILQNALRGDNETIVSNEETIANGKKNGGIKQVKWKKQPLKWLNLPWKQPKP